MSATIADLSNQVTRLQQHVTWLHGQLQRLSTRNAMASTIDLPRELGARMDFAHATLAHSLRRCVETSVPDRHASLAALIVGQAMARTPAEQASIERTMASPALAGRPLLAVAWCRFDGALFVDLEPPNTDDLVLAEGMPHVLWHWIEELAVRGQGPMQQQFYVPGFTTCMSLEAKSYAARRFAWALQQAAMGARSLLAPPAGEVA